MAERDQQEMTFEEKVLKSDPSGASIDFYSDSVV